MLDAERNQIVATKSGGRIKADTSASCALMKMSATPTPMNVTTFTRR